MPSLCDTINAIDNAIKNVHQKMMDMDTQSESLLKWSKSLYYLVERRSLLLTYNEEMVQRIEEINAEINQKIEELEGERSERIANIRHEFGHMADALPVIEIDAEQTESLALFKKVCSTVETVKKHANRYRNEYKHLSERENFFHASAYSFLLFIDDEESVIDHHAKALCSAAKILPDTQYPLSLKDVDRIIYLLNDDHMFIFLDTRLRVILTNFSNETNFYIYDCYFLIYDSESQRFTPIPWRNQSEKEFCMNCSRYGCTEHCTRPRTCPICLRTGEEFRCFKPFPESEPLICSKCNAFCQTTDCYDEHSRICPLPIQPIHDSVLQLIKSTML